MNLSTSIPAKLSIAGAAFAVSLAAIAAMAAPLTAGPRTQTATDEATLYAAVITSKSAVAVPDDRLGEAEIVDILFMREEEKLARDVYMTLGDVWGTPIFTNIAGAESMHMTSVETLITSYGLDDPVDANAVGVFENPTLQAMYGDLVSTGSESFIDALEVGALIEEIDIKDLLDSLDETDASDVELVWHQLLSGSQNHLKAFTSQLTSQGVNYEPTVLDAATYDQMLSEAGQGKGGHGGGTGDSGGNQGGRGHGRNS